MILLRHPVTSAPEGLCYGRTDLGWGQGAQAQVDAALASVRPLKEVWTSPLLRCRDLAERFASRDKAAITVDTRLIENDFGEWEGRLWSNIPRAESDPWIADILNAFPPGGEPFSALLARVETVLADIPHGALVVTHAGVIRAARMVLDGVSFDDAFAQPVPFCHPLYTSCEIA